MHGAMATPIQPAPVPNPCARFATTIASHRCNAECHSSLANWKLTLTHTHTQTAKSVETEADAQLSLVGLADEQVQSSAALTRGSHNRLQLEASRRLCLAQIKVYTCIIRGCFCVTCSVMNALPNMWRTVA